MSRREHLDRPTLEWVLDALRAGTVTDQPVGEVEDWLVGVLAALPAPDSTALPPDEIESAATAAVGALADAHRVLRLRLRGVPAPKVDERDRRLAAAERVCLAVSGERPDAELVRIALEGWRAVNGDPA